MIVYPGRFQPPHSGHVRLYEELKKRYGNVALSLDVRPPDSGNPYSYEYRKEILVSRGVPAEDIRRHDTSGCSGDEERAERLAAAHPDMTGAAFGPEYPARWANYWKDRGLSIYRASERFGGFSGTAERSKGISIITDFGCDNDCSFCIWKKHSLGKKPAPKTDFRRLALFLKENKFKKKVSVSGGGDPLFRYSEDRSRLEPYLRAAEEAGLKIDIHTRERVFDDKLWKRASACVFSLDEPLNRETEKFLGYVSDMCKLRIATVVRETTSYCDVIKISDAAKRLGARSTFKELYGYPDGGRFAAFKERFEGKIPSMFLKSGDYNVCFMPDNSIRGEYFF